MTVEPLSSLAEFINGAAFKPNDWGELGKRIIRIQNLTDGSKPFNRTTRDVPHNLHVNPGDLLVSWSASLGVFEWPGPDVAVLNQHIFRVVPNERKIDKRYLRYGLERALSEMRRHLHGATMQHVNRGEFLSTEILVPPLAEQRRIAEILDKADALRAKRRAALAEFDTLTQAIFLEMFGDLAGNPKRWPRTSVGMVTDMVTGYPFRSDEYTAGEEGLRLCRGANVLPDRIDWSDLARWPESKTAGLDEFWLEPGDVVIAMDRPWISSGFKIARITPSDCPCLLVQRVARLRTKNTPSNEFIYHLLKQRMFTRHCRPTETTVPHISPKDIRSFVFAEPPAELQREFSKCARAMEKLRNAELRSLAQADTLFASLQHRAFRGEL